MPASREKHRPETDRSERQRGAAEHFCRHLAISNAGRTGHDRQRSISTRLSGGMFAFYLMSVQQRDSSQNTCITAAVGITQQFLYVQTGNRRRALLL